MSLTLSESQVDEIAAALYAAERSRNPVASVTDAHPQMTLDDAYAIQSGIVQRKLADGDEETGWKVGLTSAAMQQMLGVDEPDFGRLLRSMRLENDADLRTQDLIAPRIEPEIAFILHTDLEGPDVSQADVLRATQYVVPALEVIDSRVRDWQIKIGDSIADNASGARYVLGADRLSPAGLDLAGVRMDFSVDGEVVSSADASAVLGHPANAVAWLCNTLAPLGKAVKAGQVVLPGSLVGAVEATPGRLFRADFAGLGSVALHIT